MEDSPLRLRYVYNNEIVDDPSTIPAMADSICLFVQEDDTAIFSSTVKAGELVAIECFDILSDAREKATDVVHLAEDIGVLFEEYEGLPILVHRDPGDFDLGYEVPEDQSYVVKEQFHYAPEEIDGLSSVQENSERYIAEVVLMERQGLIAKRAFLDANKNLLAFEYPFYAMNEYQQCVERVLFLELTSAGEQRMRRLYSEHDDSFELKDLLRFTLPANQDSYLDPLAPYFDAKTVIAIDPEGKPVPLDESSKKEQVTLVFCDEQERPLYAKLYSYNGLAEIEVFNVPVEHHDFAMHAILRRVQSEFQILAERSNRATHYIRVRAPMSHESTEQIPLEPGQYKEHVSVYYLKGNFISHSCVIYDVEGTPIEERTLRSPSNFTEVFRHSIGEAANEELLD